MTQKGVYHQLLFMGFEDKVGNIMHKSSVQIPCILILARSIIESKIHNTVQAQFKYILYFNTVLTIYFIIFSKLLVKVMG